MPRTMSLQIILFLRNLKKKLKSYFLCCCHAAVTSASLASNSPTKRVDLRMQCIDQLSKWHALLTAGAIDQGQYDELEETILGDIKKM